MKIKVPHIVTWVSAAVFLVVWVITDHSLASMLGFLFLSTITIAVSMYYDQKLDEKNIDRVNKNIESYANELKSVKTELESIKSVLAFKSGRKG